MNAEAEMDTSDGLGADPDSLSELRRACDYHPEGEASMEALIDYKDALEDRLRGALNTLGNIAAGIPRKDDWKSAADFMEAVAVELDRGGFERPEHYEEGSR